MKLQKVLSISLLFAFIGKGLLEIQCSDSFFKLPSELTFSYNNLSPTFNICISASGNLKPIVHGIYRGVQQKVEDVKLGNDTRKYEFRIRLPKLDSVDCGSLVKVDIRHVVGGVLKNVKLQSKIRVSDIPWPVYMKSYSVSLEKTKIQWKLVNASSCQKQPVNYHVRVRESSGRSEEYGPLSKDNWEIREKIKLDDICVYAKHGNTKGPCSKSFFHSTGDITEGNGKTNTKQEFAFLGMSRLEIILICVLATTMVGGFIFGLVIGIRGKTRKSEKLQRNSTIKSDEIKREDTLITRPRYTELIQRYQRTEENGGGLSTEYSSLRYIEPSTKTPLVEKTTNLTDKDDSGDKKYLPNSCPDSLKPTENGYECDSSDNEEYDYIKERYLVPIDGKSKSGP